jgi:hypothetical protein
MAMNFTPLYCSCQGASSEPKKNLPGFFRFREIVKKPKNPYFCKIYLDFSVLEKFAKKKTKKSIFLPPTAKNWFNGRNFYYT